VLLHWVDAVDLFNLEHECVATHAETIPVSAETNSPELWRPLCGWKQALPSAAQKKEEAKAGGEVARCSPGKGEDSIEGKFDVLWGKHRGSGSDHMMRSVSDLLLKVKSAKSKAVKPNLSNRIETRASKYKWPAHSYRTDANCGSHTGGGSKGYAATYGAREVKYEGGPKHVTSKSTCYEQDHWPAITGSITGSITGIAPYKKPITGI
jgi:hypothetical protein